MCGIAGVFNYARTEPVDDSVLRNMAARIVHRGPDDEGFHLDPQGPLYKAITTVMLNSGPVLSLVLKAKAPVPVLWYEKFLSYAMGRRMTLGDFVEIGERAFNMERLYNLREGLSERDDTLPQRMLEEPTFDGHDAGVPLEKMLPAYYKLRGWDEHGVPTPETLERLSIAA